MMNHRPVVCFVFRYDSHLLALKNIYENISDHALDVFFCGLDVQSCYFVKKTLGSEIPIFYPNDVSSFLKDISTDYIFCAAGGRDLNTISKAVASKESFIISCFPGILLSSQLESFISKVKSHYVLLNCRKDYKIYKAICRIVGRPFNGIHFGSPWVKTLVIRKTKKNHCIIVDQLQEPFTKSGRVAYAAFLASVIKDNACKKFIFKSRNHLISPGEVTFDIQAYLSHFGFDNLSFSEESIEDLLLEVDECITISSSAAINCLVNDINVYLIDGFTDSFRGQDYFAASGLLIHYKNFTFNRPLTANKNWLNDYVIYSQSEQKKILHDLLLTKPFYTDIDINIKRSHKFIVLLIISRFFLLFLKRENWIVLKRVKTVLSRLA
ncbi:NeuE protein [Salmonella enterica]